MAEIQFDEGPQYARPVPREAEPGAIVVLVQKWGLAKDPQQAQYVLLGVAVVTFFLTLGVLFFSSGGSSGAKGKITPSYQRSIPGPGGVTTGIFKP